MLCVILAGLVAYLGQNYLSVSCPIFQALLSDPNLGLSLQGHRRLRALHFHRVGVGGVQNGGGSILDSGRQ